MPRGIHTSRRVRLATIAGHELHTQLTGALFAALMLMLVTATSTLNPVAMIPGGSDIDAPVRAVANSVYALSPMFALSGFIVYPFFAALMAGLSVMRDDEAGLSELLQSTPLTRAEVCLGEVRGRLMRDDDGHARTSPTSAFRFAPDDDSTASDGRSSSLGETVGTS